VSSQSKNAKIVFIGAGSASFGQRTIAHIMSCDAFRKHDVALALVVFIVVPIPAMSLGSPDWAGSRRRLRAGR